MISVHSYLTFDGNCREAMTFYKNCLGGKLTFQTIGESPLSEEMPEKMKNCILHSKLSKDNFVLMASDMVGKEGLIRGNSISLMLQCVSEAEMQHCYSRLSEKGIQTSPISANIHNALFATLTDKFGNHWLLHYQKNK